MSLPRFFVDSLPASGCLELSSSESQHASNALRLVVGDDVLLFDGSGGEALGRIVKAHKRAVEVEVLQRTDANRELKRPLEVLVALPKGERQKTLVDGLVQLGTSRLTPIICQRGIALPSPSAVTRLARSVVESSKQCGRNQLMEISAPQSIQEISNSASADISLVAHPYGCQLTLRDVPLRFREAGRGGRVLIGPEGGLSDEEVSMLITAKWTQVSLGARILRIEMAALFVAAWWASQE